MFDTTLAGSPPEKVGLTDFTMRNLKLILAYDGTEFSGWQVQPNLPTIQGTLEIGRASCRERVCVPV